MNTYRIGNISIADFRLFLAEQGCHKVESGNTGHEKWTKDGILRPVVFQTHIDPIPYFIIIPEITFSDVNGFLRYVSSLVI